MISLQNISHNSALTDINMTINDADYIGIAGPNGSGKSTLARIIKGIETQTSGVVAIDGIVRPKGQVTRDIGLVLANPENQLVSSSVEEDAAFGLENMNLPSSEISKKTEEALKWAGLWDIRDVPAHQLSAGQQQVLVLAGTMIMKPKYLILDEATSMFDRAAKASVMESAKKMNKEMGIGIIHISHDLNELTRAGTIYLMDKGKIVWEGSPRQLHQQELLLIETGLELPQLIKLKLLMIKEGYPVDDNAVTEEEIADEIARVAKLA